MSHCKPPNQRCARCRAEVMAAQMEEREWRRILWFHEVGSRFALGALIGSGGALIARVAHVIHAAANPIETGGLLPVLIQWRWWLGADVVVTAVALLFCYLWWPKKFDWAEQYDYWKERERYTAAKIARERHEDTLWQSAVEIVQAQEAARAEIERR